MSSSYQATFFIIPARIMNLPGLTLAFLKFYETIFQFWNRGKTCYLSNDMIKERTGITSSATIQEAFVFFEKHNEMQRVQKGKKRYLIQPPPKLELDAEIKPVDKPKKDSTKTDHALALPRPTSRSTERLPLATARHNNKKDNIKKTNVRESRKSALPTHYTPSIDHVNLAKHYHLDIELEQEKFRAWANAQGASRKDWDSAFKLWLLRSYEYKSNKKGNYEKETAKQQLDRVSQQQGWN